MLASDATDRYQSSRDSCGNDTTDSCAEFDTLQPRDTDRRRMFGGT